MRELDVMADSRLAQMARVLKDRLALAVYKSKRGWEQLGLDAIEPKIEQENTLKRKLGAASVRSLSDSHSDESDDPASSTRIKFAKMATHRRGSPTKFRKLPVKSASFAPSGVVGLGLHHASSSARPRTAAAGTAKLGSRLAVPDRRPLSQSSPVYHRKHKRLPVSHGANLSFAGEGKQEPPQPPARDARRPPKLTVQGHDDDDDDDDDDGDDDDGVDAEENDDETVELDPTPRARRARLSPPPSSPPRTPSPSRARSARLRNSSGHRSGREGADLLLYFAKSPPSNMLLQPRRVLPSTPPPSSPAPPSSILTPTNANFMAHYANFDSSPPTINWDAFVHDSPVLPSAVGRGMRTPKTPAAARMLSAMLQTPPARVQTPLAVKETRKNLAVEKPVAAAVASSTTDLVGHPRTSKSAKSLADELGGELPR